MFSIATENPTTHSELLSRCSRTSQGSRAGIAFLDEGALALGPAAGEPDERRRMSIPITFQGSNVGELWVDGSAEPAFLEDVAALLSAHVLIGWDTSGEAWEP